MVNPNQIFFPRGDHVGRIARPRGEVDAPNSKITYVRPGAYATCISGNRGKASTSRTKRETRSGNVLARSRRKREPRAATRPTIVMRACVERMKTKEECTVVEEQEMRFSLREIARDCASSDLTLLSDFLDDYLFVTLCRSFLLALALERNVGPFIISRQRGGLTERRGHARSSCLRLRGASAIIRSDPSNQRARLSEAAIRGNGHER